MAEPTTVPGYLLRNERDAAFSKLPAIREKDLGIWRTYDWAGYAENVRDFALGLASLGFQPDEGCIQIEQLPVGPFCYDANL